MRRFLLPAFVIGLLPYLLGANIGMQVTPNPGGQPNKLKGNGDWSLGTGETYGGKIVFAATLKNSNPPQVTSQNANVQFNPNKWDQTLTVAPATYNPISATLYFLDNQMKPQTSVAKDNSDYVVR